MLTIKDIHVHVDDVPILKGVSLHVPPGEVHVIMGPNGSGKSTLACLLAGRDMYTCTQGSVHFEDKNLLDMAPELRAHAGLFLAFQYPVEIPGLSCMIFLRSALQALHEARGEKALTAVDFLKRVKAEAAHMKIDISFLQRALNTGFSGGEKKRFEILQLRLLAPKLAILDETDSGLDIDALRIVADGINAHRSPTRSLLLITHYQRLLDYVVPDRVHIMYQGRVVQSGDKHLVGILERDGYDGLLSKSKHVPN